MSKPINRLPLRDDVKVCTYHRNPTAGEIKFGHAVTHYRDFYWKDCCFPKTRIPKKHFVASDGLRYYR